MIKLWPVALLRADGLYAFFVGVRKPFWYYDSVPIRPAALLQTLLN